jgi:Tetracyclin repressor-like, C-terminal domain
MRELITCVQAVAETMAATAMVMPEILKTPASGKAIAKALVSNTKTGATPLAGFQIMLRSASSEVAAQIGREQIEKSHHEKIAGALRGEMAAQRAALVLSIIAGFQVMRQMIGLHSLSRAEPDVLVKILAPLFQMLIDGNQPTRSKQTPRRRRS